MLSRSSRVYDREFKRDAYFALGVHEVWLVDLLDRCVAVSDRPGKSVVVRDTLRWTVPGANRIVPIDLAPIFQLIEQGGATQVS